MDTKSMHCKHPKKMKPSKDKHEVFVLPPDILKELGISFPNINGSQEVPADGNGSPSMAITSNEAHEYIENIPAPNCNQKPTDTSILETASLMKKSVFLSPTFVSNTTNAIPGEVEISRKNIIEDSVAVCTLLESQDSVFEPSDSNEVTKVFSHTNNNQEGCLKVNQYNNCMNGEQTSLPNINQEHPCASLDGNEKPVVEINMTFDENLTGNILPNGGEVNNGMDNDYSFKSDNNVKLISSSTDSDSVCGTFNDKTNKVPAPKSSKIDIISDETIPLSKLREIKRLKRRSLNGKKIKPLAVQSVAKITIKTDNCGLHSIMEPKSTVPLENTKILPSDLDEINSEDNIFLSNLKSTYTNEQIEATAVLSPISLKNTEVTRTDIISNTTENVTLLGNEENVKDHMKTTISKYQSPDKDTEDFKEDKTKKAINDCDLYDQNKTSEDDITLNAATVNGIDEDKEVTINDVGKSVTVYNGQKEECIEPAGLDGIKKKYFAEREHKCNNDKTEQVCPIREETVFEEHTTVEYTQKPKLNTKKSRNSKNNRDNSGVKKITEHKIASKNVVNKTLEHHELTSILNATQKLSSNITDIKVDKVKEIAAYLKKFSHIYTDKKKTKKALSNDITKKEKVNSNTNTIESKLCIQGVEKPGGTEVVREHIGECKVLKTYARRNPSKVPKLSAQIHKNETCNIVDAVDLDLETVNISTCEMQQFCLCDDFGRLAYYDHENLYEHIHFWHHHIENCELDLIFAIYNDEAIISNSEIAFEKEEKTEEKIEAYNVCWNIFQSEFSENVDNSDTKLIGHKYVINEVNDANVDVRSQVPELNIAQKVDDGTVPKTHEVHMKNNSHSDIILETINHDVVDAAESKNSDSIRNIVKPLNTDINDNNSAPVGSEFINTGLSSSQAKLIATSASKTESSEISNVFEKSSSDAKEKPQQHRQSSSNEKTFSRKEVTLDSPKTSNIIAPKRILSGNTTPAAEPSLKKSVKCGLCNNIFSGVEWEHHVANQHHLIAWRAGGSINLDDPKLGQKLKERLKTAGVLECSLCCMQFKKFNRFMEHIKYCVRKKLSNAEKKSDKHIRKSRTAIDECVTCGVCQRTMLSSNWLEHIGSLHDYLAWKQGQEALNLDKEPEVWQHLQNIIRLNGCLTCYKCGLQRSRVQKYLAHIKTCNGTRERLDESSMSLDMNSSSIQEPKCKVELVDTSTVKCGVCEQEMCDSDWIEHICKTHNYLAWQEGETPLDLDDEEIVRNHLQQIIRQNEGLTCHKCGLVRKRVKLYLTHIEMCDGTNSQVNNSSNNISLNTTSTDKWFEVPVEKEESKVVKCGVCSEEVPILEWVHHAGKEHDYLAWQDGAIPLNLENELAVKVHLLEMSKLSGGLVCNKCEKRLKYPKTYLQHTKECTGPTASQEAKLEISTSSWIESFCNNEIKDQILTCGVCDNNVESDKWFKHIETKHQYLAWVKDQPPLDVENAAMVQKHLNEISKAVGGLTCAKCGIKRKYVKWYLLHAGCCQARRCSTDVSHALMNKDIVECAVCGETMEPKEWRNHAMKQHYNIAWVVGDNPIEINNPYAVENYLKEYQLANNKLVCKVCKISRVSYVGFYAHIIVCGKTEKETEIYKSVCDICNNKYLRIYKSQHMTMHREKEYAKERKLLAAKEQALKKEEEESAEVIIQTGRRKAAEKAKNVIENYKKNFHDGNYHCSKCGYNSEVEKELSDHVCIEDKWGDASDSDESVKIENFSGDETEEESDIDSNVSDEEREAREQASSLKKKKHSDSSAAKICRLPYQINNTSSYLKRSTEEFIDTYLTDEDLFPLWHSCKLEEVPENELMNYMPPIEESCKVRFDENQDWLTFNRFESSRVKDTIVLFLGACIQCMSWVPAAAEPERAGRERVYLSVATHRSDDAPRHAWDVTLSERGIIQIWDCANLIANTPQFVLGIAHNFGTVWAIDWCPSGARDVFHLDPTPGNTHRLGLMAAACSNGLAYIFVVPYPSSIKEKERPFYKLNPVVELRLASNENRRVYQATAIKWSVQKGHSQVVVGYADGTTAYYDLNGESPLLRTTENNRTVLYPYHDERVQNSCIEDMDMYPSGAGSHERAGGVVCVGSAGGAGAAALQSHVAAVKVLFPPHWPAALLAGDDCLVKQSINELEWWGGGRRLGGSSGAAGCAWCGRVCVSAPPLLRQLRPHPCFPDLHKQVIARILMIPFGAKRKRQNDELAMIVEPLAYSDAVKKYGVEFKQITAKDRTTQQKLSATPRVAYPERFPLSDVAAMKFCPTFKQHHKLAVGMHSGLIFIINV